MTKNPVRVAIQGEEGSYHDKAAQHYFSKNYEPLYCNTFEEVFAAVTEGRTNYGMSAVENSLVGSIVPVYDLLRTTTDVKIVGEIFLAIHHALIGLPGAQLDDIRVVYSHPVALDQCRKFLKHDLPNATAHATHDTAGSADYIKQFADRGAAAIASADNAERLNLQLLQDRIEDNLENYTRFLVLAQAKQTESQQGQAVNPDKTSLLIERLDNERDDSVSGTLYSALGCLARHNVSLTKIESRPIQGRPWRYVFYLDCAIGVNESNMRAALQELDDLSATWRLLGTYQAGRTIA